MNDELYKEAVDIFHHAVELGKEERKAYLERACNQNPDLREYVEQLLAEDTDEEDAFEDSNLHIGRQMLVEALGMDESFSPPRSPKTVGRYHIIEKIGEGGMGSVYLAKQDHPNRRVALKMIRPGMLSPGLRKRFLFEAEVLGKLQHPGIAQIYDAGEFESEHGSQPYFAMEYIRGVELRQYVKINKIRVRARLELVARIADAVQHAHLRGIVHRDLKPENVLVMEEPAPTVGGVDPEFVNLGQPKVLDFGVARATDADIQLTTMQTEIGQLVGTLLYMSPEQVAGDSNQLDTRSDIYALGVLLYELLAGRPPFDLKNRPIPEAVRIIQEEEPTRLGSMDTAFRGDIDTIACKALEKDRKRRYCSAAELASDIRRYLSNEPIIAHPPSTFYQLKKFAQRHKGFVAGLALTLLVLIAGIISSVILTLSAMQNEALAKKNEKRALSGEAEAERNAHRLTIIAAQVVGEKNPLRALEHLKTVPPESRHWEWRYLYARFNPYPYIAKHSGDSHPWVLPCIAHGPGNGLLAALGRNKRIELIDIESGEVQSVFQCNEGLMWPSVSIEGKYLSAFEKDRTRIFIWNIDTKELLHEIPLKNREAHCAYLSPKGNKLLICFNETPAVLFDVETGQTVTLPLTLPTHRGQVAFSAGGDRLVVRGRGILSTKDMKWISEKPYHASAYCFSFSPNNDRIAMGITYQSIHIIDSSTLDNMAVLHGHTKGVYAIAFSPDGRHLASTAEDNTVRVWDLASGDAVRVFLWDPEMGPASSVVFSRDGKFLAAGSPREVRLWRWREGRRSVLEGHDTYVYRAAVHPHSTLIASGSYYDTVHLWDALTGEQLTDWRVSSRYLLGFTPDGARLVGGQGHKDAAFVLSLWDPHAACRLSKPRAIGDASIIEMPGPTSIEMEHRFLRAMPGDSKVVSIVGETTASSPDGAFIVRRFNDGNTLFLWDVATGERIRKIVSHDKPITATTFSPDGKRVLFGDISGVITVCNIADGAEIAVLEGHLNEVFSIAFHPSGTRFASGGRDSHIILWDAEALEQVLTLRGHTSYVMSLVFSPDGAMLVSASGDRTVRIWDSVTPAERWRQVRKRDALRREAEPLVDRLLDELDDPLDVADFLRKDGSLDDALRREALMVLLKRASAENRGG